MSCEGPDCDDPQHAEDVQLSRMETTVGDHVWLDLCASCRAQWGKRLKAYADWESAGDYAYDMAKDDALTGGRR